MNIRGGFNKKVTFDTMDRAEDRQTNGYDG